jgi:DNA repair photolyase
MAPILPGLNDSRESIHALMLAAKHAGASWAAGDPLRMGRATRHTLIPWLERERPDLARRYQQHYQLRNGVRREYYDALKARILSILEEIGLDRARRDRTFNDRWSPEGAEEQTDLWGAPR